MADATQSVDDAKHVDDTKIVDDDKKVVQHNIVMHGDPSLEDDAIGTVKAAVMPLDFPFSPQLGRDATFTELPATFVPDPDDPASQVLGSVDIVPGQDHKVTIGDLENCKVFLFYRANAEGDWHGPLIRGLRKNETLAITVHEVHLIELQAGKRRLDFLRPDPFAVVDAEQKREQKQRAQRARKHGDQISLAILQRFRRYCRGEHIVKITPAFNDLDEHKPGFVYYIAESEPNVPIRNGFFVTDSPSDEFEIFGHNTRLSIFYPRPGPRAKSLLRLVDQDHEFFINDRHIAVSKRLGPGVRMFVFSGCTALTSRPPRLF